MTEEKYIRLNTVLKPPQEIVEKVITLSQEIGKKHAAEFILDGRNFFPHLTLYSPEYPQNRLDDVMEKVNILAEEFPAVNMEYKGLRSGQGFIVLDFALTPAIKKMHETIVKILNPLREGHHKEKYDAPDYQMKMSDEQKNNIIKYGYPDAMGLYHPHLSIIRLKDEKIAREICQNLTWSEKEFTIDTLAVYKMGKHGTCTELEAEFKLS
ncbi:MAG: 2'-5' RNA ligase family protein [Patescibacteria group bacterium]